MSSGYDENPISEAEAEASLINAYDPEYITALNERGIYFADDTNEEDLPRGFDELWKAILAPRDSPKPDDIDAKSLR